jgi:hypothetical protein
LISQYKELYLINSGGSIHRESVGEQKEGKKERMRERN